MKKIFFLLALSFTACSVSFSQWNIVYTPSTSQTVMSIKFYDASTGYHAGVLYSASTMNIHKTTNGGLNYTLQSSNWTAQRFMTSWIFHPDTVMFAGNYGKIIRTYNGGLNWNTIYADTLLQFWGLWFINSNTGFVEGSNGRIMKTTNKGDNWEIIPSGTSTALDGIYFVNSNTGYIGGANVFLKTTDGGNNWSTITGLFISPFETATSIYFSDENTGVYGTNASRIVRTTDGGVSWTEVYAGTSNAIWGLSFVNSNTGYGCTSSGKVMKTTNGGINWGVQNTPLTENLYEICFPNENTGYIAAWSGKILKTTNGGLTYMANSNTEIPRDYYLKQNYPNPFNPSTVISFGIKEKGIVNIRLYDVSGKEVKTIINEYKSAGIYDISVNLENLSTGMYFYNMEINGYKTTKKLVLMK